MSPAIHSRYFVKQGHLSLKSAEAKSNSLESLENLLTEIGLK